MDDGSIFMIVALIILIGLSAFFSAAETAYNSLNEIRLRSKAEDGDAKAAHTLALVERYDSLLSTILIGNNIVNIGASSLATVLFTRLVGGVYGPTVSTIVMTLLVLTFGEITPKSMAKEMPETLAMGFAPVLSALVTIFTPLNALFGAWKKFLAKRFDTGEKDTITEGELVTMVSEAEKDGELTNRESELIRSAIEFDDVEAQDVLTPAWMLWPWPTTPRWTRSPSALPRAAIPVCRFTTIRLTISSVSYMRRTALRPCRSVTKMSSWRT